MFRVFFVLSAAIMVLVGMVLSGCGGDESDGKPASTSAAMAEPPSPAIEVDFSKYGEHAEDAREIYAVVVDAMQRLKYQDKTGLYENEFEYFREEKTMDDYLKHGEVTWANADSLDHVQIEDIVFFDRDSAYVQANFMIDNPAGVLVPSPIRLVAYYHQGRWIKPYMSTMQLQLEYEERVRQAEEDAQEEW